MRLLSPTQPLPSSKPVLLSSSTPLPSSNPAIFTHHHRHRAAPLHLPTLTIPRSELGCSSSYQGPRLPLAERGAQNGARHGEASVRILFNSANHSPSKAVHRSILDEVIESQSWKSGREWSCLCGWGD